MNTDEDRRAWEQSRRDEQRASLIAEIVQRAEAIRTKEPVTRTVRCYLRSIGSAALCDPLSGYSGGSRTSSMLRRSALDCAALALLGLERSDAAAEKPAPLGYTPEPSGSVIATASGDVISLIGGEFATLLSRYGSAKQALGLALGLNPVLPEDRRHELWRVADDAERELVVAILDLGGGRR